MKVKIIEILFLSTASIPVWDLFRQMDLFSPLIQRVLWVLSVLVFLFAFISLLGDFHFESNYFKSVLVFFLCYQSVIVIRGFYNSSDDLVTLFREPQNFLGFIIPLIVFLKKDKFNITKLFNILYILGIIFITITIFFPKLLMTRIYAEIIIGTFAIGCGFILLNAKFLNNKKVNISYLVIILSILSLIYLARRSSTLTFVAFLLTGYIISIKNKSNRVAFRFFPLVIVLGFFSFLYPNKFSSKLTERLSDRLYEDSRTVLFNAFFNEMEDYMIFGKGMNGTYYFPIGEWEVEEGVILTDNLNRNIIENGYLQLYLTGGLINVIVYILLLLPAAFLGIFRSYNQLTMACGFMIFLRLIDMLFFGLPIFSVHYIIIWICVGICYKKSLRKKTNEQISTEFFYFNNKSHIIIFDYKS